MVKSLDQIKERIAWFQKERPYYREILDLYGHVVEEQVKILPLLKVTAGERGICSRPGGCTEAVSYHYCYRTTVNLEDGR